MIMTLGIIHCTPLIALEVQRLFRKGYHPKHVHILQQEENGNLGEKLCERAWIGETICTSVKNSETWVFKKHDARTA